ncbi:phage tail fiber protein [Acinetobacter junii]|uniref:phage tail fiber domain-containing protein n=1 Tax=Acinetobacter junii TaxID=40215 RepID=UPI003A8862E5
MTVENTNPIQHFTANGETTVFAISFAVEGKDNIKVTVNGSVVSVNDYSYDALTEAVVFNAAPEDGAEVVVERVTSLDRSINYQTYDNSFRPETLNYDLDRIWHVLQEDHITDAEILARIKDEIEWRRTHDTEWDALAQAREGNLFNALKSYMDTIGAMSVPNLFDGITDNVVITEDGVSQRITNRELKQSITDLEQALNDAIEETALNVDAERVRATTVESSLTTQITDETARAIGIEQGIQTQLNSLGVGNKAYKTYAAMTSDIANIPANSKVTVTNDSDTTKNGDYQFDGTIYTKSIYDPLAQAKAYTDASLITVYKENLYSLTNNHSGLNINPTGGAIRASTNVEINVFHVEGGKTYSIMTASEINKSYVVVGVSATNSVAIGATTQLITLEDTSDPLIKTFTTPISANYAYINTYWATVSVDLRNNLVISSNNFEKVVKTIQGNKVFDEDAHIVLEQLDQEVIRESDIEVSVIDLYSQANEKPSLYVNRIGSNISTYTTSSLVVFKVAAGKTYYITSPAFLTNSCVGLKSDEAIAVGTSVFITLLQDHKNGVKKFTVPADSEYEYAFFTTHLSSQNYDARGNISIQDSENLAYVVSIKGAKIIPSLPDNLESRLDLIEAQISSIDAVSPLTGLSWAVIGDSITEHNFRTHKNYHDYVSDMVGGMTIYNYGTSSNGWNDKANTPNLISENPDIVTVFLGTNDFGVRARPLGSFGDGTGVETVAGSINLLLTNLVNKFPTKRLAILLPIPRYNSYGINGGTANAYGTTLRQISELIVQYANHYGIPYLDLYNASGLAVYNSLANSYYFTYPGGTTPDGVHPNDLGHQVIARKVKRFLEEII